MPTPIAVENFQMLQDRQTADTMAAPAGKASRVNLLNWDGKGSPSGLFPARPRRRGGDPVTRTATSRRPTALTDAQLTVAWQAASLLLGYPDEELLGHLDLIEEAAGRLPEHVGEPLRACVARVRDDAARPSWRRTTSTPSTTGVGTTCSSPTSPTATPASGGWRCCGSSRPTSRRGSSSTDTELPDHLCVVLEYAATVDHEQGRRLILDHRAGLELLRISLTEAGSRWAGAVEAVTATLPPLRGDEMDAVRRLAAEGPPAEEVGLTPYETPAFDPGPAHPDGPTLLPMPSFPRSGPLMDTFLWVIVPYLCLATFVVGHFWRYRYDKFGWTTRSSQLYEDRLLRIGSPLFHFGMLGVVGGHVIGLLVPQSWTDAVGISEHTYHVVAVAGGLLAGVMALVGHGHPDLPTTHRRAGLLGDHSPWTR